MFHSTFIYSYDQKYLLKLLISYTYTNPTIFTYPIIRDLFVTNRTNHKPKNIYHTVFKLFNNYHFFMRISNLHAQNIHHVINIVC